MCIITGGLDGRGAYVDCEELGNELSSLFDFYYVDPPHLTRELSALLPENIGVFGGAFRIFRIDFHLDPEPRRAKLFNLRDLDHGVLWTPKIIEEIWAAANAVGLLTRVEGSFDSELKVFIPKLVVATIEDLAAHYGLNSVTLGLVREANRRK